MAVLAITDSPGWIVFGLCAVAVILEGVRTNVVVDRASGEVASTRAFRRSVVAALASAAVALAVAASSGVAPQDDAPAPRVDAGRKPDEAKANMPVILLTGFEPFGEKKPPNPSWEAIKTLDGQE